jgi:hypothetical protein
MSWNYSIRLGLRWEMTNYGSWKFESDFMPVSSAVSLQRQRRVHTQHPPQNSVLAKTHGPLFLSLSKRQAASSP